MKTENVTHKHISATKSVHESHEMNTYNKKRVDGYNNTTISRDSTQ